MRVAVTGATSDFGAAILPALLDDPDVDSVVGLGRRQLAITHPKLEFVRRDIRSSDLVDIFRGCEVVIHLAFVVEEIRDKSITHDINIGGSRNVIDSAYDAGVSRVVVASSINAYGPRLRDEPLTEDDYPEGDPDRYYFHDKAEVEHYAEWWLRRHPDEMTISMLRPTYIIGPAFDNDGIDQLTGPIGVFPQADLAKYQFLHQNDMVDAFVRVAKTDLVGPFNLGPDGSLGVRELAAMQGQRMFDVPERPAVVVADIAFRLGLTPFSGQWVTAGETEVDSTKLKKTLGWEPTMTCKDAAAVMILLQGKSLLRTEDALRTHASCEAALEPATRICGIPSTRFEHLQVEWGQDRSNVEGAAHVELHDEGDGPVVVIVVPVGSHARHHSAFADEIATAGIRVALVDLPGHGLSTGRRGRVDTTQVRRVVDAVTAEMTARFGSVPTVATIRSSRGQQGLIDAVRTRITGLKSVTPTHPSDRLLPGAVTSPDVFATHLVERVDEVIELVRR
ncbi:NAD-dependent epimerase/dehydratase family protein [Actinomycetes bacterium M1A6_2h]